MDEFTRVLKSYAIDMVIDVRRFPHSRKFPHFNKENLEVVLPQSGIAYVHFADLGGFRKEGYQAFSKSEEFHKALEKLLKLVEGKNAAVMCAEILWWRCHRRYIANALATSGHEIVHIFDEHKTQLHTPLDRDVEERMKCKIFCDKKDLDVKPSQKLLRELRKKKKNKLAVS
jgi:uncharacterized protein (DUF488 family)